jgi:hypothetical protein
MVTASDTRSPGAEELDRRLGSAVAALGWAAEVVAEVELLGDRVDVAYSWDEARHAERAAAGTPPLADPWMLECATGAHTKPCREPAPVQIVGVLVRRRGWRGGRRVAAGFSAFGPVAVLLAPDRIGKLDHLDADRLGIGLLADADPSTVIVPPAPFTPPPWTAVQRLAQEIVYATVLARQERCSGVLPVP